MGTGRRTAARAALLFTLLAGGLWLSSSWWLPWFGEFLVLAEAPAKADLAIALAGDDSGNRILKAAELVRQGWTPLVLVSGPDGHYGVFESDLAIAMAVRHGYAKEYFAPVPHREPNTRDEARVMLAEASRRGARSVLVVTSQTHTRRAGNDYRRQAGGLSIRVIAAPNAEMSPSSWWVTREGRKTIFFEWLKTIASWLNI